MTHQNDSSQSGRENRANRTGFTWQQLLSLSPELVFYLEGTTKAIRTGSNSIVSKNYPCQNQILLDIPSSDHHGYNHDSQNQFEVRYMYLPATTTATRTGFLTFLRLGWSNSVDTTPSRIPDTVKLVQTNIKPRLTKIL